MSTRQNPPSKTFDSALAYFRTHDFDVQDIPGVANQVQIRKNGCGAVLARRPMGALPISFALEGWSAAKSPLWSTAAIKNSCGPAGMKWQQPPPIFTPSMRLTKSSLKRLEPPTTTIWRWAQSAIFTCMTG